MAFAVSITVYMPGSLAGNSMLIGGLQKTTLIDYPGKVACTVFLSGCNFRCPWCYAPHLVLPEKIKEQEIIEGKHFFNFLTKRRGLLEGVCICGGEPTIHQDLPDFIKKIKEIGYLVKLDTNGSNPEMLKKLLAGNLLDYFAMDIKASLFDSHKYFQAVGVDVDLEKIRESVRLIKESGVDYEFRTTLIPNFHQKEDIIQMAHDISPAKKYYLQNFREEETVDSDRFTGVRPYSREFVREMAKEIAPLFEICQVRE